MGTKVQCKSSLPGFHPMRELSNDSNSHSWHLFYGERTFTNSQYHNVFLPRASANGYLGDDKDVVKQKMLEHEAIFKNQVFELHRLYRIQRDLMDKIKSTELGRNQLPADSLFSSSPLASHVTSEDASRRNLPCFPVANSSSVRLSFSGVEEGRSSLKSVKGNSQKPCFFPPQNESTMKESQTLESKPRKLRRKMLDLQLPADEYIDSEDGEQFSDGNVPDTLSHNHIKSQKIELEKDVKLYADDGEKTGCPQNARKSGVSCLTDLNEPIQIVETNTSPYVDPSSGPKSGPIDLQRKSSISTDNVTGSNLHPDNNTSRGGILPHFLVSGHSYSHKNFFSQGLQTKMWPVSSQPMPSFLSEIHEAPPFHSTDKVREEQSREGSVCGLKFAKRSHEINGELPCSFVPSHMSAPHLAAPDFSKSWSNSNSSWESATTNFQKLTSAQTQQCLNLATTTHMSSHSSFHGMESVRERWLLSNGSRLNKGSDSGLSYHKRAFLGSPSEYKEEAWHPASISYNYWKQGNENNQALLEDSNSMDMNCQKEGNFNMVFSNSSSSLSERKAGETCALLPWLRGTIGENTETTNSGRFSSAEELSYVRSSINSLPGKNYHSFHNGIFNKEFESDRSPKSKKLLTLPICEGIMDSKRAASSLAQPSVPSEIEESRDKRVFDINLPCEDPLVAEPDKHLVANKLHSQELRERKVSSIGLIDLNLSLSDDEVSLRSTPKMTVKRWREIDLEAPAISDTEDIAPPEEIIEIKHELASKPQCKAISQQEKLMELAAEAIVFISSSVCHSYLEDATCNAAQDSMDNPLNWLVEMAFLCANDCESECQAELRAKPSGDQVESSSEGMDSFESMTLGLMETNVEEYMPNSLVPGHITMEEKATNLVQSRSRKVQARRGRQRRDFQRDILPGLSSLSRQEVTEDLNTFGGLMRAAGHAWNSGLTKRNSSRNAACGRGRRRSVASPSPQPTENLPLLHQSSNPEIGLDNKSLTGWGKTTRRPRRQRVPADLLAL
ncbi:uncharacterized protein LOC111004745 isoform X2 [Momordica charantia]|uniref:Uncharacterized protein LOC111004745 isoform X2 n=1 Tax=Momordica charantia TaxID=3673 RepID=A0A6J1BPZ8_MOMCH|nr:uncharacterized protein LOC111004745 isoform X2 [Momordica charantia]